MCRLYIQCVCACACVFEWVCVEGVQVCVCVQGRSQKFSKGGGGGTFVEDEPGKRSELLQLGGSGRGGAVSPPHFFFLPISKAF